MRAKKVMEFGVDWCGKWSILQLHGRLETEKSPAALAARLGVNQVWFLGTCLHMITY
jgi:hypothetical protein